MGDVPGLSWAPGGQQKERRDAMQGLAMGFVIALIAIYGLLAVPFRSYVQPLIIMAVIPFGLVGAVIGHWVMFTGRELFTDQTFNFSMMSIFSAWERAPATARGFWPAVWNTTAWPAGPL